MRFRIVHFSTIPSTNDYAHMLAERGAPEGIVITSDYQTRGRGRYRRRWVSPRGQGLLFSLILRPKCRPNEAPFLTQLVAKAIQRVLVHSVGLDCTIKRPNDLLVRERKICGILTEAFSKGHQLDHVILGVGLNVSSRRKSLVRGATSILEEKGQLLDRDVLLELILKEFRRAYPKS